jgi:hypothetical protein
MLSVITVLVCHDLACWKNTWNKKKKQKSVFCDTYEFIDALLLHCTLPACSILAPVINTASPKSSHVELSHNLHFRTL